MPLDNAKNFAKATVSGAYDADDTSIVLASGHGARMPTAPFNAVWWDAGSYSDPSDDPNVEVVRVTNIATDTLTITRAQEGTSATTKSSSCKLIAGLTALAANSIATTSDIVTDHGALTGLSDDDHTQYYNDARHAAATTGHSRVVRLDNSAFNGVTATFTNLIPSSPDLVNNTIILFHSGIGPLLYTSGVATAGEFSLSGTGDRTPTFGYAPQAGDQVYAVYIQA